MEDHYCYRCGGKLPSDAPFETDDGTQGTVEGTGWGYCKACNDWTEYPPVVEETTGSGT